MRVAEQRSSSRWDEVAGKRVEMRMRCEKAAIRECQCKLPQRGRRAFSSICLRSLIVSSRHRRLEGRGLRSCGRCWSKKDNISIFRASQAASPGLVVGYGDALSVSLLLLSAILYATTTPGFTFHSGLLRRRSDPPNTQPNKSNEEHDRRQHVLRVALDLATATWRIHHRIMTLRANVNGLSCIARRCNQQRLSFEIDGAIVRRGRKRTRRRRSMTAQDVVAHG